MFGTIGKAAAPLPEMEHVVLFTKKKKEKILLNQGLVQRMVAIARHIQYCFLVIERLVKDEIVLHGSDCNSAYILITGT